MKPIKPLGRKAYGSIPHLPDSRVGPKDYCIHEGQALIATVKTRDKRDRVIVTEKLDGSCMAVANIDGDIVALTRAGYAATDSEHEHQVLFSDWVRERAGVFLDVLTPGERIVGEWLALAHGTLYSEGPAFVAFDLMVDSDRLPTDQMRDVVTKAGLPYAHVLQDGPPMSIADALSLLGDRGFHGAEEYPEGAVWRIEREGVFDFACKFVRHDKVDGKYFSRITGGEDIWMRSVS